MRYIFFDLDGTICESKQHIEAPMFFELERLNQKYKICIISGAELSRMLLQAPIKYATYMAQNGNEVLENSKILWQNVFNNKEAVIEHIVLIANELQIVIGDDMIEDRGSQISFSFVGHHAPLEEKKKFDSDRQKRMMLLNKYPFNGAVIGGTTCIDYVPYNKGENIKRYLDFKRLKWHECLYIGDAFMEHGNDETVMGIVPTFQVKDYKDTLNFIKQIW